MTGNFPKLKADTKPQVQESQSTITWIKKKKLEIQAHHIQTTENQRPREKLGRNQRKVALPTEEQG